MLLTTCPTCQAQFKVSTEQLNIRSGRVMCGRCRNVFNAFESLQRTEADIVPELRAAPAPSAASGLAPRPIEPEPILDEEPTPAADVVAVAQPATLDAPAFLQVNPPDSGLPPSLLTNAQAPYRFAPLTAPAVSAEPVSRTWGLLAFLASLILAGQCIYLWRSELVSRYPELRPHLATACDQLGCSLPWGRDQNALRVENSDLIEELGKRGRFLLTATIANRAASVQDFPWLELSLTDTSNQTLVRRVLAPGEYLGRPLVRGEGMAANSTAQLNVRLEAGAVNASGYHLELFYP